MVGESSEFEGYEIPLYAALTQPQLFAGVPRELGILTLTLTLLLALGLHLWWIGAAVGVVVHGICVALTRRDAHWSSVFLTHLKNPTFLDW